ncbi:MAG: hypothetical protein QMD50_01165 [Patescibacteria group bacterium]|nr:hypothetical protein [Patescibacteria group bacterium]
MAIPCGSGGAEIRIAGKINEFDLWFIAMAFDELILLAYYLGSKFNLII